MRASRRASDSDVLRHLWAQFTRALGQEADKRWRVRRRSGCLSPVAHSLVNCAKGIGFAFRFCSCTDEIDRFMIEFVYQRVELHIPGVPAFLATHLWSVPLPGKAGADEGFTVITDTSQNTPRQTWIASFDSFRLYP